MKKLFSGALALAMMFAVGPAFAENDGWLSSDPSVEEGAARLETTDNQNWAVEQQPGAAPVETTTETTTTEPSTQNTSNEQAGGGFLKA
jgi:hypothetical protein